MNKEKNVASEQPGSTQSSKMDALEGSKPLPHTGLDGAFLQRSDAAQEIISRKPGFFEKWALLVFMGILLLLMAGTWFIRYPDLITARGRLSANNGPKEMIALQSGRLIKLFVNNGQQVHKDDPIAWLESTANTGEVIRLSAQLDSSLALLADGNSENVSRLFTVRAQQLGGLQAQYQVFSSALQQYNDYLVNGFYVRKKQMLLNDMNSLRQMNLSIEKQKNLTSQDGELALKTLEMNKILFDQKVISAEEYRIQKSKYYNKQMAIPQLNAGILSNQNQQRDKHKELEQLDHDVIQQKMIFEQALQTLKSNVDNWIHLYTIQAPLDGTVFFTLPLQKNKFIQQGNLLGYINPPDSKYYVEITLPQHNLGKIDTGMPVQLRFDAYPYQEKGFVKGKLDFISSIASDSGYLATVRLSNGLVTHLQNNIQYKNGLQVEALVITKNMRLLERLYYNIVKATSPGK